jgi:Ran GTPase-activating protein (RanGAP) involved in mRNA processing and transport
MEEEECYEEAECEEELPPSYFLLSRQELVDIFIEKCRDTGLRYTKKLFQRFYRHYTTQGLNKILRMESVGLGPLSTLILVQCFYAHPAFRVLSISGNNLGDEGAFSIADLILQSPLLISLDISSNSIQDAGCAAIFQALRTNNSLIHLHIGSNTGVGRNSLGNTAASNLCSMLWENHVLSELDLSMTEITSDTIGRIIGGLSATKTLYVLNLANNNIKSRGAILVCQAAMNSHLREINFASNHISDDVGPFVATFIKSNKALTKLDLSGNFLGAKFTGALAPILGGQPCLRELILARNPLGGRGASALGAGLAHNESIVSLDISCCQIEIGGFREFSEELKKNQCLQRLNLQHNTVADIGAVQLAEAIAEHPAITEINLDTCEVSDQGIEALMKAAGQTKITKLNLRNNLIHRGLILQQALSDNQLIRWMNIEFNDIDYKTYTDVTKMLAANDRRHKAAKRRIEPAEREEMRAVEKDLAKVRTAIGSERNRIVELTNEREESRKKLKDAQTKKAARVGGLEKRHREISNGVDDLLDMIRTKRSEAQYAVQKLETEVSQVSTRLARELDTFQAECKALSNLEERIRRVSSDSTLLGPDMDTKLKDAKTKYRDNRTMLESAWQMQKEIAMMRQLEEEAAAAAESQPAESGEGTAKGKRKGSPKGKGGKGKRKPSPKGKGKGKGKGAAKEPEPPKEEAATEEKTEPAGYQFETAPPEVL